MQELRESVQLLLTTKIAVYLMTFLIVTVAWAAHIRSHLIIIISSSSTSSSGSFYNSTFKLPYVSLSFFCRLFQVIVRIDDCLALLNLVSTRQGILSTSCWCPNSH